MYHKEFRGSAKSFLRSSLMICSLAALVAAGCQSSPENSQDKAQQDMTERASRIVKESGGDWDKVSDADKSYFVKDLSGGDETSGKMLFMAKAGKVRHAMPPNGPPRFTP